MLNAILGAYEIDVAQCRVEKLGSGLINGTWKITANETEFILQQVNKNVFKSPQHIAENIDRVGQYLSQHYPGYLLIAPVPSATGETQINFEGEFYRLFPFVKDSITINAVNSPGEAFEAASQFGQFTRLLNNFPAEGLHYTLPGFHDLTKRYSDFEKAIKIANAERLNLAADAINIAIAHKNITHQYHQIVADKLIPLRVIHHDTKISNVLFNEQGKALCVIDLDTVMPGYYISDVGDMMRTYLSPTNEEETDLSKIEVREDFFRAIAEGYLNQMGSILTAAEKALFVYSGEFMIYMQALRFLTDHLNNDIYYGAAYPGHNLQRAKNQFTLLEKYIEAGPKFQQIADTCIK